MKPLSHDGPIHIDPTNVTNVTPSSHPQATEYGMRLEYQQPLVIPMKGSGYESLRLTDAEVERIAEKVAERVFLALDRRDEAKRLMAQFHVGDR